MINFLAFVGAVALVVLACAAIFGLFCWWAVRREKKARELAHFNRVVFGKEE
jgi:hypothetical protein